MLRFADDYFSDLLKGTIGIEFKIKRYNADEFFDDYDDIRLKDIKVSLQIWDTTKGGDRFRSVTKSYYAIAHGVILVYDVTNLDSFKNVKYWIKEIKEYCNRNASILLVGNKIDLESKRVVSYQEGVKLAEQFNISFIEASAKEDINVNQVFLKFASEIKDDLDFDNLVENGNTTTINLKKKEKAKSKCY